MNRFTVVAYLSVAVAAGCANRANTASEDTPWLEQIDEKLEAGEFDAVVTEGTKYVEKYPGSFRGWGVLGWGYLKSDKLDKARECFDKSLEINPQWDNAHVGKGVAYRKDGDNDNARKSYLEAIRIRPDNPEAYSSLLVIELLEGRDKKAVEYGEKAWSLRKDSSSIPANLAVAYHYLGDIPKRDQFYKYAEQLGYHRLQTIKDIFDGKTSLR